MDRASERHAEASLAQKRLRDALATWGREKNILSGPWLYVCARRRGRPLKALWIHPAENAIECVERDLGEALARATSFELEMLHSPQQRYLTPAKEQWNSLRGKCAMFIELGGQVRRWAALEMLAANISFQGALNRQLARARLDGPLPGAIAVTLFQTRQLFCDNRASVEGQAVPVEVFRGSRVVPLAAITQKTVFQTAQAMTRWLAAQVNETGACSYKYWPSRGEYAGSNNAVRQWMATVCLNRAAKGFGSSRLAAIAKRNLAYNLSSTFKQQDDVGYIWMNGSAKLGAAALAALAILESAERRSYLREDYALYALIGRLTNPDGSFDTFFIPRERKDNQNFYSGEALLFLAARYRVSRNPQELARIMAAFHYYRDWHRAQRNPAFVPWHTQAYFLVWQVTRDESLRDFIFEMNDWVLSMQQWESAEFPDMQGRFYDPARPHFGPPHASSTGVYLEGLADAFALASQDGDEIRRERYRIAIVRGIRSLMQLQFKDAVDCFYVTQVDRVLGGVRTTVYDNTIRIDNVQHALMALLKIHACFNEQDYQADVRASTCDSPSKPWRFDDVRRICSVQQVFNEQPWAAKSVVARNPSPETGCIYFARQSLDRELSALKAGSIRPAVIFAEAQSAKALANHVSCPVYQTSSLLEAARSLADAARSRMRARIIGITGSVGKTSTKDALAQILALKGATHATHANANDGWGVLDTLMNLPSDARFAVVEMGMLGVGSISIKAQRTRPHVGIITNIHDAHLEFHRDPSSIAATKSGLFEGIVHPGVAILPRDSSWYDYLKERADKSGIRQVLSFGLHPQADFRLTPADRSDRVCANILGRPVEFQIAVSGKHWALTAMSILAAVHSLGLDLDEAMKAMRMLKPSFRRGEVHRVDSGSERYTVIDDTWNASPASVVAALESLDAIESPSGRKILFLADMLELGEEAVDKHIALIEAIIASRVDKVYTVGRLTSALFSKLPPAMRGVHFREIRLAVNLCRQCVESGDLILVKGSHAMEMWRIVSALRRVREIKPGPKPSALPTSDPADAFSDRSE